MESKEIRYGGRWLDVIGKQLILYAAGKKYSFCFEICMVSSDHRYELRIGREQWK